MPYSSTSDLPSKITQHLPRHAQEIYLHAFNNAWNEYADPSRRRGQESHETVAHKVAWSAVKHKYHKSGSGYWVSNQ